MSTESSSTVETSLVGGRSTVTRLGNVVFREPGPWSATTIALLRHLELEGFAYAPRVIDNGFDEHGREMLTYVEGESPHPYSWNDEALPIIGTILRDLHKATASFEPPDDAVWRPWFGRNLGEPSVIGHCDTGAWNIIAQNEVPKALIDWEEAGPVDPLIELAQACWLNALLFDDDLAKKLKLGSVQARGKHVRALLDGYELPAKRRVGLVGLMRDFAILNAANETHQDNSVVEDADASAMLEAVTWRVRSAGWLVKHHDALDRIVTARI